jgi:hypothetical protein
MKLLLKAIPILLVVAYLAALTIPLDPVERRPGLGLAGDLASDQATDWSFLDGRNKILVQVNTWYGLPHSVTTSSWVFENDLYVPCGRCGSKNWPKYVARDSEVTLKVNDKLYERRAVLVVEDDERLRVMQDLPEDALPEDVRVYRMEPRG